jgi:hypothetical protein
MKFTPKSMKPARDFYDNMGALTPFAQYQRLL